MGGFLRKRFIVYVFVLVVVLTVALIAGLLINQDRQIVGTGGSETALMANASNAQIEIVSQLDSFDVKKVSVNQDRLQKNLVALGLDTFESKPHLEYFEGSVSGQLRQSSPEKITVVLRPVEKLQMDREGDLQLNDNVYYTTLLADGSVRASYVAGKTVGNGIEILVYVNEQAPLALEVDANSFYSESVLSAVFFNFQAPPITNLGNPISAFLTKLEDKRPIFEAR